MMDIVSMSLVEPMENMKGAIKSMCVVQNWSAKSAEGAGSVDELPVTVCLATNYGMIVVHIDVEDTRKIEVEPRILMKGSYINKVMSHLGSEVLVEIYNQEGYSIIDLKDGLIKSRITTGPGYKPTKFHDIVRVEKGLYVVLSEMGFSLLDFSTTPPTH